MLLSICIPTKDRVDVLKETLESIYLEGISSDVMEVVISDNSDNDDTKVLVDEFIKKGMLINYFKSSIQGFYNSVIVMNAARGSFIKLHNNYTKFKPKALREMLNTIRDNEIEKPQILFTDGNLNKLDCKGYNSFDSFIYASSYWNTWSSAFSIWKCDLENIAPKIEDLNSNFPHASLLFLNSKKNKYIIDDRKLFDNSLVNKKGGYNIFKLFCVIYIEMLFLLKSKGDISAKTVSHIKVDLRNKFIPVWLQQSVFTNNDLTFDNSDYMKHITTYYNISDCFIVAVLTTKNVLYWHVKRLLKK